MAEKCAWYCPVYKECQDSLAVNIQYHEKFEQQRSHTEGMGDWLKAHGREDEWRTRLSADEARLARNTAVHDQLTAATREVESQFELCSGPTLGVVRKMLFALAHRHSRAVRWQPRLYDEEREGLKIDYRNYLRRYGQCRSALARHAIYGMPQLRLDR